mmetsp:Transcript_13496/g.37340  ORF Transcript_13496/g.37340 Transcript_13496/m.37340 type:complete len:319 (+) Transcript_13496:984-1940(+)
MAQEGEGPRPLLTVTLVRPEAVARAGLVLRYAARSGFAMAGARMLCPEAPLATSLKESQGSAVGWAGLAERPCLAVALRKECAIGTWLGVCGPADPAAARREAGPSLRVALGATSSAPAVAAPETFEAAEAALALLFPDGGLDCGEARAAWSEPDRDDDPSIVPVNRRKLEPKDGRKGLREVVLVVVTDEMMQEEGAGGVLEWLQADSFTFVGLRTARPSTDQAKNLASMLPQRNSASQLAAGTCLLVAIERNNALSRLQALLTTRGFRSSSSKIGVGGEEDVRTGLLWSETTAAASAAVAATFDALHGSMFHIRAAA